MYHRACLSLCVLVLCMWALPAAAQDGTLRIGAPTVDADQYSLPIFLTGGDQQVSALNFRLQYDPEVFRPVSANTGPAAQQSDKQVSANMPTPGEYVVVMMGLNQNTVQPGEVARVVLERVASPESGQSELRILDQVLATVDGGELPSHGQGRVLAFGEEQSQTEDTEEQVAEETPDADASQPQADQPGEIAGAMPAAPTADSTGTGAPAGASPTVPRGVPPIEVRTPAASPADSPDRSQELADRAAEAAAMRAEIATPGVPERTDEAAAAGGDASEAETHLLAQASPRETGTSSGVEQIEVGAAGEESGIAPAALAGDPPSEAARRGLSMGVWIIFGTVLLFLVFALAILRRSLLE